MKKIFLSAMFLLSVIDTMPAATAVWAASGNMNSSYDCDCSCLSALFKKKSTPQEKSSLFAEKKPLIQEAQPHAQKEQEKKATQLYN